MQKCSRCGADVAGDSPEGHCLQCLLQLGLEADPEPALAVEGVADSESRVTFSDSAASSPVDGDESGHQIGSYTLLRLLGEGGCGVVYLARQEAPLRRTVALKLIKPGMDSRRIIARFEAERQALALMDHPNIAKILDAGATRNGRLYFVMEWVQGQRITDYCDHRQLPPERRLDLFIQVCHAIQHAHQKGIIHRDLKPSNILVCDQSEGPIPKVIDFGIAKAIADQRLTEKTVFTAYDQFMGTPAYMSPEQAELGSVDIDTRSDIYSLGVLLYELLTGHTPFDTRELSGAGLDSLCRTIRQREPPRPSTRLHTMKGEELADVARRRGTDPPKLIGSLQGDLDWIVMKCLEKDRRRRYATANGLAADLERYRAREPVLARPPSRVYRLQRTVQRNKLAFAATGAVIAALIGGLGISTWLFIRESKAHALYLAATLAQTQARQEAQRAQRKEVQQRQRAEAGEQASRRLLYDAKMSLAQQAWEHNDLAGLRTLLSQSATSPSRGFEWYYWQRQAHSELKTLRGHLGSVVSVAFFPDGQRALTASDDGTAKVWDAATGRELMTLTGHRHRLICACVSPDGRRILTGSRDRTAKVWDADTGRALRTFKGHDSWVMSVAYAPDGKRVITADVHGNVIIWPPGTGQELLRWKDVAGITKVIWSPDGQQVITCSYAKTVKIWNSADGKLLRTLPGIRNEVYDVAYSPDGREIITAGDDGTARIWEASQGTELRTLQDSKELNSVAVSPDGRRIVTSGLNRTAEFWDAQSGKDLFALKGHEDAITSVALSPNGGLLITGSADGTAKIWQTSESEPLTLERAKGYVEGEEAAYGSGSFSPDGLRIIIGAFGGNARMYDPATGELLQTLPGLGAWINSLAFSPDGRRIVVAPADRVAHVWNAVSGEEPCSLEGHLSWITAAGFSPDSKRIVTGSEDRTARIWDAETGKQLLPALIGHTGAVNAVAFSPRGDRVFTGSEDGTIRAWDASAGRELLVIKGNQDAVKAVACSPDGLRLASGGADGTASMWDASTGQRLFTIQGHESAIRSIGFSPDGQRLVTGSVRLAKVWDSANGEELMSLPGPAHCVAFSPNGKQLLVGRAVWNAATQMQLAAWQEEETAAAARLNALRREKEAAVQKAKSLRAQDPGAIKQWLVLAPIPIGAQGAASAWAALDQEQLPHEAGLRVRAGDKVSVGQSELVWSERRLPDYILDFNEAVGKVTEWSVAYAVCYIHSEAAQSGLILQVGSDDESKIYLNGRQIYRWGELRQFRPNEDLVEGVSLQAGCNVLIFKVVNEIAGWLGSIWLTDAAGHPVQGISVSLSP